MPEQLSPAHTKMHLLFPLNETVDIRKPSHLMSSDSKIAKAGTIQKNVSATHKNEYVRYFSFRLGGDITLFRFMSLLLF